MNHSRLKHRLDSLKAQARAGFVPFIMAGDPSVARTHDILAALPAHGADIIELGMPFSDPTADGPIIQAAGLRALKAGFQMQHLFAILEQFRQSDTSTPLILMGYANPVFHYGIEAFMQRAAECGADGLILVDVPAEERAPYQNAAKNTGLCLIPLIAPTSLSSRLSLNCEGAEGFVYYISIKGITGTASASSSQLAHDIALIREHTALPIAAGFGINTPEDVARAAQSADLVVVGSAIVKAENILATCRALSSGLQPR